MGEQIDVLVVGGGPTGLVLATDLARRGVTTQVIDAGTGRPRGSRAKGLQPRTLEVFEDLGVLGEVAARATRYPKLALHLGPVTLPKTMIRLHEPTEAIPHPDTLLLGQDDTEDCLRHGLDAAGGSRAAGTRLRSYEQDVDGVTAILDGPDGEEQVRCRYLVGADGAASTVRKQAGIDFAGSTDEGDHMLLADVAVDGLSRDRWHLWPRRAGRFTGLCPLPGTDRFQLMIRLQRDEQPTLDLASLDRRVRQVTGLSIREVTWSSVWRPNIRLAARYRDRRVLLAGDAAHVHTPAGAQGLNTGVQDAYNLGWKLGQVLAGAPDALLDSYEAERRPVAARVLGLSSELYDNIAGSKLAAIKRGDEERQLTLSYRGGPLASPEGAAEGTAGSGPSPVLAGDRAPDARYVEDGRPCRLFDAFRGPHFTLLALGPGAARTAEQMARPAGGAPIEVVTVAKPPAALIQAYGLTGDATILVRPDGYVAHHAKGDDVDGLARSLAAMTPGPQPR